MDCGRNERGWKRRVISGEQELPVRLAFRNVDSDTAFPYPRLQSLLGHTRIYPSPPLPGGLFPFLSLRPTPLDPYRFVSLVSFSHRPKFQTSFSDYSARYGAVWDEDKRTLRETLLPELVEKVRRAELNLPETPTEGVLDSDVRSQEVLLEWLIEKLDLKRLLDLPMIALSNGQTRKARIVKTLVGKLGVRPELVLLDEGLSWWH